MLQLSAAITNQPVMSIRTGSAIATAIKPIINPNNLKIEGWYCQEPGSRGAKILQVQEVRDIVPKGIVIDDHEALAEPADLIRLKEILAINFELPGKVVVSAGKKRVGKVTDFAVDMSTLYIQKLYVSQNIFKSFTGGGLIFDRTQILEITSKRIVVQEPLQGLKAKSPATVPAVPA